MADEREILKYQLDVSDVEAKVARVNQLTASITEGRARGEDTSVLEQQLAGEIDALNRVVPAQKKAATETEKLLQQKEKLASVVGVLGGQFGGMVGQLANIVGLLNGAGPAALKMAAGLAAVTATIAAYQALEEQIKRVVDLEQKREARQQAQRSKGAESAEAIDDGLAKFGASSAANVDTVSQLTAKIMSKYGLSADTAQQGAIAATAVGATGTDEAARIALAIKRGAAAETADDLDAMRATLSEGENRAAIDAQLAEVGKLPTADIYRKQGRLRLRKLPLLSEGESTYEALRREGKLPESVRSYADFEAKTDELRKAERELADLQKAEAGIKGDWNPARPWLLGLNHWQQNARAEKVTEFKDMVDESDAARGEFIDKRQLRGGGTVPSSVTINEITNVHNTGTMRVHAPEHQRPSAVPSVSKSPTGGG